MNSKLQKQLEAEKIAHVTTCDLDGTSGTVATWFFFYMGKVYMSTGRDSVKMRRIADNPRVGLQLKNRKAPITEGRAQVVTDPALIRQVAERLFAKYEGSGLWWHSVDNMVRGYLRQDPSVLLEITLDDP